MWGSVSYYFVAGSRKYICLKATRMEWQTTMDCAISTFWGKELAMSFEFVVLAFSEREGTSDEELMVDVDVGQNSLKIGFSVWAEKSVPGRPWWLCVLLHFHGDATCKTWVFHTDWLRLSLSQSPLHTRHSRSCNKQSCVTVQGMSQIFL